MVGRPDDGTDPAGFYNVEIFVPLKPRKGLAEAIEETGWRRYLIGTDAQPHKEELVKQMNEELDRKLVGVDWNFSQNIRDNVMEALSGVKGDNSVKIFGPDLDKLEELAADVKNILREIRGHRERRHLQHQGPVEPGVPHRPGEVQALGRAAADVNNVIQTALGRRRLSTMIEGEKTLRHRVRWPRDRAAARPRSSTSRWTSSTIR